MPSGHFRLGGAERAQCRAGTLGVGVPSGHGAERARRIVRVRPTAHSTGSPNGPLSTGSPNGPLSTGPTAPLRVRPTPPLVRVRPTAHSTGSPNGPLSTGSPNGP